MTRWEAQLTACVVLLAAALLAPTNARAQTAGGACTGAQIAALQTTGNNLYCNSSVWTFPAYQFGAATVNSGACAPILTRLKPVAVACAAPTGAMPAAIHATEAARANPFNDSKEINTGRHEGATGRLRSSPVPLGQSARPARAARVRQFRALLQV